jgi:hypothetical protein
MRFQIAAFLLTASLLAGCSNASPYAATVPPAPQSAAAVSGERDAVLGQSVYWTLFASCSSPQIQLATVPLKKSSKAQSYDCTHKNGLAYTSGMAVDSTGRLWVLYDGPGSADESVAVFKLPLKATSLQRYSFILSGTNGEDALAFDPSGNLWVSSPGNSSILEYTGPFNKSGTLSPSLTIPVPSGYEMYSIAFDKSANLYAANFASTGKDSIGVLAPPYTGEPYFLKGVKASGGLIFDKNGDLYASSSGPKSAIVRYDNGDLKKGDTPSIVDPTGIPSGAFEAAFAFSKKGDLYGANCGGSPGVDVWPLSRKKFGSKLPPSVLYTNADITQAACVWGIAIQ